MEPYHLILGALLFLAGFMLGGVVALYNFYKTHWKERQ
jgi:hypothetical protein